MNKFTFYASSLLTVIIAAACTQELADPFVEDNILLPKGTYGTVPDIEFTTFDGTPAAQTKVSINPTSLAFSWSEGDQIGVIPMDGVTGQTNFAVKEIQGDARKCSFDGGAWSLKEGKSYCAYFPLMKTGDFITNEGSMIIDVRDQCQMANGDASHLSGHFYMYAPPVTNTDGTVNFKFKHLLSILNFVIPAPATTSYTSLKIEAEEKVFAVGSLWLDDGISIAAHDARSNTFTIDINYIDVNEGEDLSIFASMFAWDYNLTAQNNGLRITLTDSEDTEYYFSALFGKVQAGKGYQIFCTPSAKTTTFSKVLKFRTKVGEANGGNFTSLTHIGIMTGDNGGHDSSDVQVNDDLPDEVPLYARKISNNRVMLHTAAQKILLPSNINGLLSSCSNLTSDGLANWTSEYIDASDVTNASSLFSGCTSLTTVSLDMLKEAEGITTVASMFKGCTNLTSVDISALAGRTGAIESIKEMFYNCTSLQSVDLSGWDTPELTNCDDAFSGCIALTTIDLTNLNTKKVTSMNRMMRYCQGATDVYLGTNFVFPNSGTDYIFEELGTESSTADLGYCTTFHCSAAQWTKVQSLLGGTRYRWAGAGVIPDGAAFNAELPYSVTEIEFVVDKTPLSGETVVFDNIHKSTNGNKITFRIDGGKFLLSSGNVSGMFRDKSNLEIIQGLKFIDWTGVTDMSEMFSGCRALRTFGELNESNLKGEKLVNMSKMFKDCGTTHTPSLSLPSDFSTSKVTDMSYMFAGSGIYADSEVKNFDTSSLVNASHMFDGCTTCSVLNLTGWNVRKISSMEAMFQNSTIERIITDGWNTSRLENVNNMFCDCTKLSTVASLHLDISKVRDLSRMFCGCRSLDYAILTSFSSDRITNMNEMFRDCSNLKQIDISRIDVNYSTTLEGTFNGCKSVEILKVADKFYIGDAYRTRSSTTFSGFAFDHEGMTKIDCPVTIWEGEFKPVLTERFGDISNRFYCSRKAVLPNATAFHNNAYMKASELNKIEVIEFVRSATKRDGESLVSLDKGALIYMSFDHGTLTVRTEGDKFYLNPAGPGENYWGMFQDMTALVQIKGIEDIDASEATSLKSFFNHCSLLPSLDLSTWDVSNVTDMTSLFEQCFSLETVDMSTWNTSKVTSMSSMFSYCRRLQTPKISSFNTSQVVTMDAMFRECVALKSINLSSFNTTECLNYRSMFKKCESLQKLDLKSFDFTKAHTEEHYNPEMTNGAKTDMFYDCKSLLMLLVNSTFMPYRSDGAAVFNNMGIFNSKPYTEIDCTDNTWANIRLCMEANDQNPDNYSHSTFYQ